MEARMRAEVPERKVGEERHGAEPPLERDVERKAEDMSQMMGMFSKLVSSFVGAGNAEGIEQLPSPSHAPRRDPVAVMRRLD